MAAGRNRFYEAGPRAWSAPREEGESRLSTDKLKETIQKVLPDVETVICWQEGFDKLHTTPLFLNAAGDADKVVWNALCAQNLTAYLPSLKNKKVAVVVKGCDSRTIVQFMEEGAHRPEQRCHHRHPLQGCRERQKGAQGR